MCVVRCCLNRARGALVGAVASDGDGGLIALHRVNNQAPGGKIGAFGEDSLHHGLPDSSRIVTANFNFVGFPANLRISRNG
jgi:hypothetical protein